MLMKRHVSAYLEATSRFTNAGYIETNVGTVWLDVEISSSALYSAGYTYRCADKRKEQKTKTIKGEKTKNEQPN
jgi:hypothetical protein